MWFWKQAANNRLQVKIPPEKELLKKVRQINIRSRRMVNDVMAGEYQSAFKGRGMEFDMVREYQEGDEERMIDWNVTARFGQPYVKSYVEERELTVIFLVDISASGQFGSAKHLKKEVATELCAVLAFNAIKKNDRVGLILFSDQIELYIPPKKGKTHVLRVIRELLYFQPRHQRTSINSALEFLNRVYRRRAVVFLVSDFLDQDYFKNLNLTSKRHDLVALEIVDPSETEPAAMGLVEMLDPETGEHVLVDTSSNSWRERYRSIRLKFDEERVSFLRKIGVDRLKIKTDQPFERDLINFFKKRSLRS
ncbi:MAG: DUF58 domain-containing protein [Deltaproteobacteria bacterium]|nr:DUF58 domain-containing protein [Deltaproteobacteria bacterium]